MTLKSEVSSDTSGAKLNPGEKGRSSKRYGNLNPRTKLKRRIPAPLLEKLLRELDEHEDAMVRSGEAVVTAQADLSQAEGHVQRLKAALAVLDGADAPLVRTGQTTAAPRLYELGERGTREPLDWATLLERNAAYWKQYRDD